MGYRPCGISAVLSVTDFDYLFIPPLHTLGVDDLREVVALVVFFATAVVVGLPAARFAAGDAGVGTPVRGARGVTRASDRRRR